MGIELGAACMPSELASDRATAPGGEMNFVFVISDTLDYKVFFVIIESLECS